MKTPSTEALRHWLVLKLVPQMGVKTLHKIIEHRADQSPDSSANKNPDNKPNKRPIETFLNLPAAVLRQFKLKEPQIKAITQPNQSQIERMEQWASEANQHIICYDDPRYPDALKHIASPPMLLFVRGDFDVLNTPGLAIVGSRNLTITGQDNAFNFAKKLAEMGITVTSGLAIGVDGFSHRGALEGRGKTIAVLGTGLNQIYPKRHRALAQQVSENGALVSEFLPDQTARPENFPRRNRIISGLSQGTLVIEAAIKSGSLITAKYAMEQDREVFAIPGSIHSPMSKGCHWLIKQGAKLVEDINDIVEELSTFQHFLAERAIERVQVTQTSAEPGDGLLKHIGFEATAVDSIAQRSLLPIPNVLAQLLDMELAGKVAAVPGGYLRL
ncbi:MAG: DNA-protecting protein DprA [Algicola sp.]|nr:DNA-protecting protein DprA [Algicola sp.]